MKNQERGKLYRKKNTLRFYDACPEELLLQGLPGRVAASTLALKNGGKYTRQATPPSV